MNVQEARFRKPATDETSEQLLLDPSPSFIQRTGAVAAVAAAASIRLLLAAGLGGCVAVAVVLRHAWKKRGAALALAFVLVFFHLVVAPFSWLGLTYAFKLGTERGERIEVALEADLDKSKVSGQRLISLWSDPFAMMSAPARWHMSGGPLPKAWWTLSLAPGEHHYTRVAADTLELELANGRLLTNELEHFCRPPGSEPFTSVALEGMRAEVVDRDAEGIRRVRFKFDRSLDDPSLVLIHWENGVMRRLPAPEVGSAFIVIPPAFGADRESPLVPSPTRETGAPTQPKG